VHPDDRGDADGCVETVTVTGARPQFIKTSIMKIGILTQYYEPEIGAPQARLSALANALVERGHEVYVLTGMPSYPTGRVYSGYGGAFRRETLKGVRVFRSYIYATKSVGMAKRLANYFSFVLSSAVAGCVCLPRLDCLITESPPLFLGMTGYVLSRLKGARWVFNVSDLWPESAARLGAVGNGRALRLAYGLEAFCYRKAWLVTGQSTEIVQNINERFPEVNTLHLSNGVDTDRFTPAKRDEALRRRLVGEGTCLAMYAGLYGIAQGLERVLDAAAAVSDMVNLKFVFVGDGPEKEKLIERSRELGLRNVRFEPPAPSAEMPALVASADIALVPLKTHLPGAVPSKLYEAMASGRPVLLAANGEAAIIVREHGAGIAVEPGDSGAMAAALRLLSTDLGGQQQMGSAGRRAAVQLFDRRTVVNGFINYLEKDYTCSSAVS
jgi:glycosyltransferase involved in cell wall biosynthesis